MKQEIIDLSAYTSPGEYDLSSRIKGLSVRVKSDIDQRAALPDTHITIIIPAQVYSVSFSFWKELLGNIIMDMGADKFYSKFSFESTGRYQYEQDIKAIVEEISIRAGW